MATYLVRCVEIGREQQVRLGKLRRDLAAVIAERLPGAAIALAPGRLVIEGEPGKVEALAELPGVASVSACRRVERGELAAAVVELARGRLGRGASFAVRVRWAGGRDADAASSLELKRSLGDAVVHATGARVELSRPDVVLGVELRGGEAFIFDHVIAGVDHTGPHAPHPPRTTGEPRFVADQMLGRLAAWLRLVGYDTATVHDLPDSAVVRLAAAEGRTLLTRDGALARTRAVPVLRVAATTPRAQLVEVLTALALAPDPAARFSRCTRCNAVVEAIAESDVHDQLPPGVRGRDLSFKRCPACAKLYWQGSHVERIRAALDEAGLGVAD